jgi:site-specific recombinase XerC
MTPGMEVITTGTGAAIAPSPALHPSPSPSLDQVREYIRASKAENTLRGYQSDWRAFCAWAGARALCPMPASPEVVAAFIADCAGRLKVGSVQRRLNAIAEAHKALGLESPTHNATVRNTMKGIRRTKGVAPAQKTAALTADIRTMVDAADAGTIGARDRALILLGFAGAFRRSELVGLDVDDCAFGKDGLTVTLRRSKTDQAGAGRKIGIPYGSNPETCPVRTMQAWIELATISAGPVFRSINRHGQVQPGRLSGIDVGARREETGTTRRAGRGEVCRAFAAGRARHQRRDCRSFRTLDHEPDRASIGSDGTGAISGMAVCFGRTARGSWDCKPKGRVCM